MNRDLRLFKITGTVIILLFCGASALAQNTMTTSGNWTTDSNWSSGTATNGITTSEFNNGVSADINNGENITSGSLSGGNNMTLQLNGTSTLDVGNASNALDFTTNNGATISIGANGVLTIWGDLVVNNDLVLVVAGELIVKGNIELKNGGALDISGNVTVDGDFVGGNNTAIDIDGDMDVGGNFNVGNGSTATGTGTIAYGGTCDDSASGVCASGPLPVELALFNVRSELNRVIIEWTTATEENNDYFTIERSTNGIDFEVVANVNGNGNSTQAISYHYVDNSPLYGRSYYRLKQTDFDGANETFKSKSIYRSNVNDLVIQPNPVQRGSKLSVYTGAAEGENVELSIFTASGINIITKQIASSTEIGIQSDLEPGLYVVKVKSGTNQLVKRLLIK